MADVNRDRAQFFIVTGLVLAVLLVALALILNSAIYTGNLATRESSHDTRAALQERHVVDDAVGRAIRYSNIHNPADPQTQLGVELDSLETELNQEALNGVVVGIQEVGSPTMGTRIAQLDDGQFTAGDSNDGDPSWKLMDTTRETETFALRMQRDTLFEADTGSEVQTSVFEVELTEVSGTNTYQVYVFKTPAGLFGGNAYLTTVKESQSLPGTFVDIIDGACAASGQEIVANFPAGTFGPSPDVENPYAVTVNSDDSNKCDELAFYDSSTEYQVRYVNGDQVQGEYELITTRDHSNLVPTQNFYTPGGQDPFSHPSILSTTVEIEYETSDVSYVVDSEAERRRERVFTGAAPVIQEFAVTDDTPDGGDPTYHVDWTATDADGDLSEVRVTLYDTTEGNQEASKTFSVSGDQATMDNVELVDADGGDEGNSYEIRIQVVDQEGHVTVETKDDTADGSGP